MFSFFYIGRLPNTKRLNLEAVGVELDEMGAVKVDEFSRTNIPSIWAIGDVTNRLNLTPVALMEGTCFSKTVFGGQPTKPDYNNVPCAVFCIPPLCVVGLSEEEAIEQAKGDVSIFTSTFNPMKNTISGQQEKTVTTLVVDSEIDKVIRASMCGPDAPEIMQVLYLCRQSGHWGIINVVGAMTLTHCEIARTFREKGISCDVIWMDIDYMNGFRCFTFDQERVLDPKSLVKDLHLTGFKATKKWKKCIRDKDGEAELQVNKTQKQLLGTNDGVTKAGLLAATVAGSIIGLTFVLIGFFTTRCAYDVALKQLLVIPISALAGLYGSVIDSLLGATLQFSGFCSVRNKCIVRATVFGFSDNMVDDHSTVPFENLESNLTNAICLQCCLKCC